MISRKKIPIIVCAVITSDDYFENTIKSLATTLNFIEPVKTYLICAENRIDQRENLYVRNRNRDIRESALEYLPSCISIIEDRLLNSKVFSDKNESKVSYSYYILTRLYAMLYVTINYNYINHVLIQQWDSCVINPDMWDDEFLEYDYIGALWPFFENIPNPKNKNLLIGNGGFSLRSFQFLQYTYRLQSKLALLSRTSTDIQDNEDLVACIKYQDKAEELIGRKINFPPLNLARKFSVERPFPEGHEFHHSYDDLDSYRSFGFHGNFNTAGMRMIQ